MFNLIVMKTGRLVLLRYPLKTRILKQRQVDPLGQVYGRVLGLCPGAIVRVDFSVAVEQTLGGILGFVTCP